MKRLICGSLAILMIALPLYAQSTNTSAPAGTAAEDSSLSTENVGTSTDQEKMEDISTSPSATDTPVAPAPGTGMPTDDSQMQQDSSTIDSDASDVEMQEDTNVSPSATTPSDDIEEEE